MCLPKYLSGKHTGGRQVFTQAAHGSAPGWLSCTAWGSWEHWDGERAGPRSESSFTQLQSRDFRNLFAALLTHQVGGFLLSISLGRSITWVCTFIKSPPTLRLGNLSLCTHGLIMRWKTDYLPCRIYNPIIRNIELQAFVRQERRKQTAFRNHRLGFDKPNILCGCKPYKYQFLFFFFTTVKEIFPSISMLY